MELVDVIVIAVIVLIIGAAVAYIIKQKRSGKRCIGCPDAATCNGNCAMCRGCKAEKQDASGDNGNE